MTIGAKIAACRKRAGMSQEKLANELNISRQAVSRWETGEAVPDTEKVIQLSRISMSRPIIYYWILTKPRKAQPPPKTTEKRNSAPQKSE